MEQEEAQSIFFHYFLRRQNGQWVFFLFFLSCLFFFFFFFRRKRPNAFEYGSGRLGATVALANAFRNKFPNQLLWLYPLSTSQSSCCEPNKSFTRRNTKKKTTEKRNKQTIRPTIKMNVLSSSFCVWFAFFYTDTTNTTALTRQRPNTNFHVCLYRQSFSALLTSIYCS